MKDRVSTYPGRVRLTPVSGQENVYDLERADQPTETGTPLNKANLLSDEVAEFLDLPNTATPNDAFRALKEKQLSNLCYTDITTSGQWTVPSGLIGGKIFVIVIGGGGSGGGTTNGYMGTGGGSGHLSYGTLSVSAGQVLTAVIGAGGSKPSSGALGNAGGTTSFGGISAAGGSGGQRYNDSNSKGGYGGAGGGGAYTGDGGDASFGGGGGSSSYSGGNGGIFGGGGGTNGSTSGTGGTYGGKGGTVSVKSKRGAPYNGSYEMWDLAADYYGVERIDRTLNKKTTVGEYTSAGGGGLGCCFTSAPPYGRAGGCGFLAYGQYYTNNSYGGGGGLFYSPIGGGTNAAGAGGYYSAGNSGLRGAGGAGGNAGANGVIGIWYYGTQTRYLNENI